MYTALLDRLNNQHEAIGSIIGKIGDNRITAQLIPGKWSIKDHIAHLARYQPIFAERIQTILTNDTPVFGRYKAEDDPEFEHWRQKELAALFSSLHTERKTIYTIVSNLSAAELNRTGIHKKYGTLNIVQWTEFFLLHEAYHIFTIFQLAYDTELHT